MRPGMKSWLRRDVRGTDPPRGAPRDAQKAAKPVLTCRARCTPWDELLTMIGYDVHEQGGLSRGCL